MNRLFALLALVAATAALVVSLLVAAGSFGSTKTVTILSRQPAPGQASVSTTPATSSSRQASGSDSTFSAVRAIYRDQAPAVAQVTTTSLAQGALGAQPQQALGSGFLIDGQGHLVTNYHVIQGASTVMVNFSASGATKDSLRATVVGSDPSTDIAVLAVKAPSGIRPLELGSSAAVSVGDPVVAIGNPLGLDRTVTFGIVSALAREIQSPNGFAVDHVIQTDASINHGNSGGPLLNLAGKVIGVNSQIATGATDPQAGNVGIGFSVPADTVKQVVSDILKNGSVTHPFLGVSLTQAKGGLRIARVDVGSGAAKAGVKAGDVILKAGGQSVPDFTTLHDLIAQKRPGDSLVLTINRSGHSRQVTVVLGIQPKSAG